MRGGQSHRLGCCAILLGIIILLALILPENFWWFALGAGLICAGFWYLRHC